MILRPGIIYWNHLLLKEHKKTSTTETSNTEDNKKNPHKTIYFNLLKTCDKKRVIVVQCLLGYGAKQMNCEVRCSLYQKT